MTRTLRNGHTLSRRLYSRGGPVRSIVDASRADPAGPPTDQLRGEPPHQLPPPGLPPPDLPAGEASPGAVTAGRIVPSETSGRGDPGSHRRRAAALLLGADLVALAAVAVSTRAEPAPYAIVGAVTLLAYAHFGFYRPRLTVSILDDLPRLLVCVLAGLAVGSILRTELPMSPPAPGPAGMALLGSALVAARAIAYTVVRWLRLRVPGSGTVILGTGQVGCRLGQAMLEHPEHGLRLVGYLDDERRRKVRPPAPLLGRPDDLGRLIGELGISHVVVTFGAVPVATLVDVVRTCDRLRCEILLVPRLYELHATTRDTEHVQGLPLIRLRRAPFRRFSWRAKRALDIAVAAVLVVLLAPLLLACAVAVRIEGGPGVLFRQERVGQDGRRFQMLKFRSLKPSSEVESRLRWTIARDPRMGPVGRLLRTTSLDELPQLVNVLRGDMSLVGPRPERPHFVEQLSRMNPRYQARLRVPAGLTGWAAVNGLRGDTSIFDRVQFDNAYIQSWSLWLDIKILVRTIGAVLGRTGG